MTNVSGLSEPHVGYSQTYADFGEETRTFLKVITEIMSIEMKHQDLPDRWKEKLAEYLRSNGRDRTTLDLYNFRQSQTVKIRFEDESYAEFRYALVINAPEFNETGLFTEHCGYHIFGSAGVEVEMTDELTKPTQGLPSLSQDIPPNKQIKYTDQAYLIQPFNPSIILL